MSALSCCLAWFVLGLLLGWLLGWWLDCWKRCKSKKNQNAKTAEVGSSQQSMNTLVATPAEKAEVKVTPVATATAPKTVVNETPKAPEKIAPIVEDTSWKSVPALAALAKAAKKGGRDNLEIVEGIGPKIAGLLVADGIDTFSKLADAPIANIAKILEAAGSRYRLAKPDTWPQQAGLAAKGEWAALKALQDKLSGGVKAKKG